MIAVFILTLATVLLFCAIGFFVYHELHRRMSLTTTHTQYGSFTTDPEVRATYATDASAFSILPEAIYYPHSTAEVAALVEHCKALRAGGKPASLTVRAGGTCMSGGPLSHGFIVDLTKHLTGVTIDPVAMTATVEAGAMFRDIEDAAQKHNLMFAPYPSSHRICGIGGMLGNNASGEKSLRFGATSDNVLALEVVLADGSIEHLAPKPVQEVIGNREQRLLALYHEFGERLRSATGEVKKAASGYRLEKLVQGDTFNPTSLFVGAQGTLGIITKAVLQLTPIPQHTALVIASARQLTDIPTLVHLAYKHHPAALETFDRHTFAKAREHLSSYADRLLPHIDQNAELFILAEFSEATAEATHAAADAYMKQLYEHHFHAEHLTNEADAAAAWQVRRNSFLLMRDHNAPEHKAVPCIEDVIVPLDKLDTFIDELRPILARHTEHYGFHGHIGDGSLRIIPVFDFTAPDVHERIVSLMREVFALIKRLKGNISADHSDGIIRSPFLKEFYGKDLYDVFAEIKRLYDPAGIMNPGKKIGVEVTSIKESLAS